MILKFAPIIHAIMIEEGFQPNYRKTHLQRKGGRKIVGGTIVNSPTPNIDRKTYDLMKAILHNCVTKGIDSEIPKRETPESFRLQLEGRISWVAQINPTKGQKLRDLCDKITW